MVGRGVARREERRFGLDDPARANQVERAGCRRVGMVRVAARRPALLHEHARAAAHFDDAFDLERDQGLAHRRPAHAELLGQLALGRQP